MSAALTCMHGCAQCITDDVHRENSASIVVRRTASRWMWISAGEMLDGSQINWRHSWKCGVKIAGRLSFIEMTGHHWTVECERNERHQAYLSVSTLFTCFHFQMTIKLERSMRYCAHRIAELKSICPSRWLSCVPKLRCPCFPVSFLFFDKFYCPIFARWIG